MNLNKWFNQGISTEAYMKRLDKRRDGFLNVYNTFEVPKTDKDLLHTINNTRVIVIAEAWCGHCMMDIPILLKITEQANIPITFLPRDENLALMDQYLTNEKRFVPIFIFIDENGKQINKWGPMAPEILEYVNQEKAKLPDSNAATYETAFQKYIDEVTLAFSTDQTLWNYVYQDILKALN